MQINAERRLQAAPRFKQQHGAGMVEVLIAIVISAFALLGLASLQVSALRYQKVANYHSLASQFSAEMADRVRANLAGARAANNPYSNGTGDYSSKAPTNPGHKCETAACTPVQIAEMDLYQWRLNLNRGMAGGWGEISGDVTNGFTIRVYYKEAAVDGGGSDAADPNCRAGAVKDEKYVHCFVTVLFP